MSFWNIFHYRKSEFDYDNQNYLYGGEATAWAEEIDDKNFAPRVLLRLAAFAEVFWTRNAPYFESES